MTGYFFMVKREASGMSTVEIEDMTDEELDVMEKKLVNRPEFAASLACCLAKWIRDNVKEEEREKEIPREPDSVRTSDPSAGS